MHETGFRLLHSSTPHNAPLLPTQPTLGATAWLPHPIPFSIHAPNPHTHRSFNKSYASMSIFPAAVLTFCLISLCFIVLPAYAADKAGVGVRCEGKRATTVCLSLTLRSRPSLSFWPEQLSELSPIHCEQFRMRYFAAAVGLVIVIPKLSSSIYSTYLKSVRHFDSHPIS